MGKRPLRRDKLLQHSCQYVVLWTTKYCRDVLTPEVRKRMRPLLEAEAAKQDSTVLELEITDHSVRMHLDVNPRHGVYRVVERMKHRTAGLRNRAVFPHLVSRLPSLWSHGLLVVSVGEIPLDFENLVRSFIEEQKKV